MSKVIYDYPPNFQFIKDHFDFGGQQTVFAYGGIIYSPFYKEEIPADVELHEICHFRQQEEFGSPDLWWQNYCFEAGFRLHQECEAYAWQYNFVKKHIPKAGREALADFSKTLAGPMYGLKISKHQAETMIRQKAKIIV